MQYLDMTMPLCVNRVSNLIHIPTPIIPQNFHSTPQCVRHSASITPGPLVSASQAVRVQYAPVAVIRVVGVDGVRRAATRAVLIGADVRQAGLCLTHVTIDTGHVSGFRLWRQCRAAAVNQQQELRGAGRVLSHVIAPPDRHLALLNSQ